MQVTWQEGKSWPGGPRLQPSALPGGRRHEPEVGRRAGRPEHTDQALPHDRIRLIAELELEEPEQSICRRRS